MAGPSSLMILMMLLSRGGGNDLLDYVQVEAYWQTKGVKVTPAAMLAELAVPKAGAAGKLIEQATGEGEGAEAARQKLFALGTIALPDLQKAAKAAQGQADKAGRIQMLITQIHQKPKVGAVRRLMALRALGELKSAEGAAVLKALTKSKVLFEADYAQQALAAIAGKAYARPGPAAKAQAADLGILPAGCGIVGRMALPAGKPMDFAAAMKDAAPMLGDQDPKTVMQSMTGMLLEVAERVGNVRIHAVTAGVSSDIGDDTGSAVLVGRGLYDAKALQQLLADMKRTETETLSGLEVFRPDGEVALILPSNEQIVMIVGPNKEALPAAQVAATVKTGKGGFKTDGALGKLMKTIDTTAPLWAVAKISDAYREGGPVIVPFDTATLVAKATKTGQKLTLTATGSDAKKVAEAVKTIEEFLAEGREELPKQAERMPAVKPMADFLLSIKVKQAEATVTISGEMKGDATASMLPMMMFGVRAGVPAPPPRDRPRVVPRGDDF